MFLARFWLPSIPLRDRSRLPAKSGIYYAVRGGQVLYVGKSSNLRSRWAGHHEFAALKAKGNVRLYWRLAPKWRIAHEEAIVIARYKPPLNGRMEKRCWWVDAIDVGVLVGFVVLAVKIFY